MSSSPAKNETAGPKEKHRFGTFGGVFTPSILTILGVIMFMRANFVVGQAGIFHAVVILLIAKSITLLTSFSIGAVSTNMKVRGGGAYYMISRVLGPEFGGAIGIALFFALALSVPFYFLGFTEALCRSFEFLTPYFMAISLSAAALFFVVAWVGAGSAIKTQYVIMAFLFLAILSFMGGAAFNFNLDTFRENWGILDTDSAAFDEVGRTALKAMPVLGFWAIFAIYFPAVTGIDAGVNMSGDLKDPGHSIPRGTLAAVGVGFLVYLGQAFLCGGAFSRYELITAPYQTLRDHALGGGWLVMLGVFAATLSSALGSYMAAPRVLQAVGRDPIIGFLSPFAKGAPGTDEPRRALLLVGGITLAVLLWAGNEAGGGPLNAIAAIVTMFFLYSYGMMNLAAFAEAYGGNPSFRPRFRYFHWGTALAGTFGCVAVSFLVNAAAAGGAVVLITALYFYVRARQMKNTFGDARRGVVYSSARHSLLQLSLMEEDSRNWRPTILVFSGNPTSREAMVRYALWLESGRGIVLLANVLVGDLAEFAPHREAALRQLRDFCREKDLEAFPVAVVSEELDLGVRMLLQSASVGPVRPNMAAFGWSETEEGAAALMGRLRTASILGMSLVVLKVTSFPLPRAKKGVDIWWRGQANGSVMILLAYLLTRNLEWERASIRLLRLVENEAGREPARTALENLVAEARVEATVQILVSDRPFHEVLRAHSSDADCVFLGFDLPEPGEEASWFRTFGKICDGISNTVLVYAKGTEELLE